MLQQLAESVLYLIIVLPIILLSYDRDKKKLKNILGAFIFYISCQFLIYLPSSFNILKIINLRYNWEGKLLVALFSVITYFIVKKHLNDNNYFTLKQKKGSLKITAILVISVMLFDIALNIILKNSSKLGIEDLIFQLTLPGIDEELSYRGIFMALLITSLKKELKIGKINLGNPGILISTLVFAFAHAISIDKEWSITVKYSVILFNGSLGYIYSYITYQSRSVLGSVICHNLSNTTAYLTRVVLG